MIKITLLLLCMLLLLLPFLLCRLDKKTVLLYEQNGTWAWVYRTMEWLYQKMPDKLKYYCRRCFSKSNTEGTWEKLYPGQAVGCYSHLFMLKKATIIYGGLCLAISIMLISAVYDMTYDPSLDRLRRATEDGDAYQVNLEAAVGENEKQVISVEVAPKKYSREAASLLLDQVGEALGLELKGENPSLDQVTKALNLVTGYKNENVSIEWQPEDYNLISSDGKLGDLADVTLPISTRISAIVTYGDMEKAFSYKVRIIGKELPEEELLQDEIKKAVEEADKSTEEEDTLLLPDKIGGALVCWTRKRKDIGLILGILTLILALIYVFRQDDQLKARIEARDEELKCDYPTFVHRMTLMLGAGMTVRRSWDQVLLDYEKDDRLRSHYLYREMKYAGYRLQAGVSEKQVYQEFGRRIASSDYVKFSQLLNQLLVRGSKGIQDMLIQEAQSAQKQRRDLARKMGETAGTKLLLPMILLLIVVLLIVMVPAFLSM